MSEPTEDSHRDRSFAGDRRGNRERRLSNGVSTSLPIPGR